jgi:phytoene dehydrogenase-like protein
MSHDVGGGAAGLAAACKAAKVGARVLLLEKYGFLGARVGTSHMADTKPSLALYVRYPARSRRSANGRNPPEAAHQPYEVTGF